MMRVLRRWIPVLRENARERENWHHLLSSYDPFENGSERRWYKLPRSGDIVRRLRGLQSQQDICAHVGLRLSRVGLCAGLVRGNLNRCLATFLFHQICTYILFLLISTFLTSVV